MKFIEVARVFDLVEKESSRTEMTKLLAGLFDKASPGQAAIIAYLTLGELNPTYVGTQFNFALKSMIKVLAKFLGRTEQTIKSDENKLGDLGLVIQGYEVTDPKTELSLNDVESCLQNFLKISGDGAVEKKEKFLLDLFSKLDSCSIKYVVRIILGKLRLGFSDMTLLDAFSWMHAGDKSIRKQLEEAYNICVDIGLVVKKLKEDGLKKIEKQAIVPGIPLRPAAAERLASARAIYEKLGKCIAQPKLDGFRLQVHVDNTKSRPRVNFFSRNLQDMSSMFPDLKKAVLDLKVKTLIAEGEAISFDVQTGTFLPFQETVKRRRKHDIEQTAQDFPLKLYFFDLLYLNGQSYLDKTHEERRTKLLTIASTKKEDTVFVIEEKKINSIKELEDYFEENITQGLEGLVVKKTDAIYKAGKRNFNWIKLKRQESGHLDDTIDCVILGYYGGKGKRAAFGIGAILAGIYNKKIDGFQTVAKIGTGFTDSEWRELKVKCDKLKVINRPKDVECVKGLYPDVWVSPEIVCSIRADEITLSPAHSAGKSEDEDGLALRFPRFMSYRPDKSAHEATTDVEIKELYALQFQGKDKRTKKVKSRRVSKDEEIGRKIRSIF